VVGNHGMAMGLLGKMTINAKSLNTSHLCHDSEDVSSFLVDANDKFVRLHSKYHLIVYNLTSYDPYGRFLVNFLKGCFLSFSQESGLRIFLQK
jgi:hypothetical protein